MHALYRRTGTHTHTYTLTRQHTHTYTHTAALTRARARAPTQWERADAAMIKGALAAKEQDGDDNACVPCLTHLSSTGLLQTSEAD